MFEVVEGATESPHAFDTRKEGTRLARALQMPDKMLPGARAARSRSCKRIPLRGSSQSKKLSLQIINTLYVMRNEVIS